MVVCAKSDRVLGIHLVGPEVAEILQVGLLPVAVIPVAMLEVLTDSIMHILFPGVRTASQGVIRPSIKLHQGCFVAAWRNIARLTFSNTMKVACHATQIALGLT